MKFINRFKKCGLSSNALLPCYGLAEATLCVAMHPVSEPIHYERVLRESLATLKFAEIDPAHNSANAIEITDCGYPLEHTRIMVMDEQNHPVSDGHVGQIWITGPSVAKGYY